VRWRPSDDGPTSGLDEISSLESAPATTLELALEHS
jgi:hypothetical protein